MDVKKLEKWAELLLDTGKRNNLISFKDSKAATVEVLLPDAVTLFDKIDGATAFEVFDPQIIDEEEEDDLAEGQLQLELDDKPLDQKAQYVQDYSSKLKKQSQVLLYNVAGKPMNALRNIDKKAKSYIEETGVNVAYMAFGFIHWKESGSSSMEYRAPILLVPIQLDRESAVAPYYIRSTGDDIIINPTFSYKMDAEYGVKLPEYEDEGLEEYIEKVSRIVSRLGWPVSSECKIGIFSFLKINMYRDLHDNVDIILANPNVRVLLDEPLEHESDVIDVEAITQVGNPLIDLHNVVDADSSQIEAIEMAKSGVSFVLQGPPGTGKSQTITNIIAECLSDKKRVLFVSEKKAALDVVYDKLKKAGLSEFCLELHSHKSNKKAVIADLCHTIRQPQSVVSARADAEIASKVKAQRQLDEYALELHEMRAVIEKSLYQLYESYAGVESAPTVDVIIPSVERRGPDYLAEVVQLLEQYVEYIPTIGYDYRLNPWYGYQKQDTSPQTKAQMTNDLRTVLAFLNSLRSVADDFSERYSVSCQTVADAKNWKQFFSLVAASSLVTPALLDRDAFAHADTTLKRLKAISDELHGIEAEWFSAYDDGLYQLNGADNYKLLTKQFNGFFSRLFNQEYKGIIRSLFMSKKSGAKPTYDEAVQIFEALSHYQEKSLEYSTMEGELGVPLGHAYQGVDSDWDYIMQQMDLLRSCYASGMTFGNLPHVQFEGEQTTFNGYADHLSECLEKKTDAYERVAAAFSREIFDLKQASLQEASSKCSNCIDAIDNLEYWCHFRTLLAQLVNYDVREYIVGVIAANLEPSDIVPAFQKCFYRQWIERIIAESPALTTFNRVSQDNAIKVFAEKDTLQFEINKAMIRSGLSSRRPSLAMISAGSAVSTLLREGEKKRRQKSIRSLLSEIGELVQIIKPCFLMSPLSVSTFLEAGAVHFDVVIFDEASQIFPQDAIGAIYRGTQLIVVGDSRQMPPSNFFNASIDTEDADEDVGDIADYESILDLCSTSMQQLRLRWHYRSRFEQLIAFSNKNFYDSELVTFPSSKGKTIGAGIDYYHVDGVFDRKSHTNRKEAEYIVDLIYQNIEKYPNRSLGVVAFSVAQQDLIDHLLSKRRQETPEKEFFFKSDAQEPFFIKNLETVQGDERDAIIFSVAYGIDAQGRLLHNFGPLNRVGGERRLNVAVTRAKMNIQLVSSMHYTDIDLKRSGAEGTRLLREYLDYAENGEIALERSISVTPFEDFDSDFEVEVYDFLKANGFAADTQVGCSGFRIDIGLKKPDSSDYVLAIECDGATYHSAKNARDRDRLRQEILEQMGWKFYRIWSTDWFRSKHIEQQRLLDAAEKAIHSASSCDMETNATQRKTTDNFLTEIAAVQASQFPHYRVAPIDEIARRFFPDNFQGMVLEILKTEAPLAEELLLKRTVSYFGREKVTSVVLQTYERLMYRCSYKGIVRKDGFLYLRDQNAVKFRGPGDITRDVKYICAEELADGMLEILKQNITTTKAGLYHSLAVQCGIARAGKAINEYFDKAFEIVKSAVSVEGEMITLLASSENQ